jgi:uncharacterized membrane protein
MWLGGGALVLVAGLVILVVAVLSWTGRLPLNTAVGIRTVKTMASQTSWRIAHRAAAPWLALGGVFLTGSSVRTIVRRLPNVAARRALLIGGAFFAGALIIAKIAADRAV